MEIDHTDGSGVPDRIASSRLNPQSRHFTLIAQTATLDRHGFRLHIFAPQSGAPYLVVSRHRLPEIEGLFAQYLMPLSSEPMPGSYDSIKVTPLPLWNGSGPPP